MKKRSWFVNFIILFVITLVVAAVVSLLYGWIAHGEPQIDWESSFRFAIIFAIVIPLLDRISRK